MSGNFRKKKIALAGALMFVVTSVSAQRNRKRRCY